MVVRYWGGAFFAENAAHFGEIFFDSNIPRGYGAGSSGAVTAAVLDLLAHAGAKIPTELSDLKKLLGDMESYFHGASSGLDPLVSYLNKSVLIRPHELAAMDSPNFFAENIFLLDTNRPRKAETMISFFKENVVKKHKFLVENELVPNVRRAISGFLEGDAPRFFESAHQISETQYRICRDMIPMPFQNIWREGLSGDSFRLKLCGAGGGGFILGIAQQPENAFEQLKKSGFHALHVF